MQLLTVPDTIIGADRNYGVEKADCEGHYCNDMGEISEGGRGFGKAEREILKPVELYHEIIIINSFSKINNKYINI